MWTGLTYLLVFLLVFPVLWMVITGFKTESAAYSPTPTLIFQPTLDQFALALNSGFGAYLANSVIASVVSTAIALVCAIAVWHAVKGRYPFGPESANASLLFLLAYTSTLVMTGLAISAVIGER